MRILIVTIACLSAVVATAQKDPAAVGVDSVISRLYSRLSIVDSDSLHLVALAELFDSGATLSPAFMQKEQRWTVEDYVRGSNSNFRVQHIQSWQEQELYAKTDVFGNIAQRFSTYEIRFVADGKPTVRRGINAIQLIRRNGTWRVHSILWDREREGLLLPEEYLKSKQSQE